MENRLRAVYPMWFSTPASDPQNAPEEVALRDALRPLLVSVFFLCKRCLRFLSM